MVPLSLLEGALPLSWLAAKQMLNDIFVFCLFHKSKNSLRIFSAKTGTSAGL